MKYSGAFWGVLLGMCCARCEAEPLRVQAADGLTLAGDYTAPKKADAPVLILLHGLGSNHREWDPLVKAAAARGWGAYAYDARGHAESGQRQGVSVSYKDPRFGQDAAFWRAMIGDAQKAAAVLIRDKKIIPSRIVWAGASLGANVALNAAAQGAPGRGVVLLSAGSRYAGIDSGPAMAVYKGSVLIVAARPDSYAYASAEELARAGAPPRVTALLLDKPGPQGAHGTQLFDGDLEKKILDWAAKLPATIITR